MFHVELAFGHCRRNGNEIADSLIAKAEKAVLVEFARLFHGGRLHQQSGCYRTKEGFTMIEGCSVISADTSDIVTHFSAVRGIGAHIARTLDQEFVLITISMINGEQHWIAAD
jgi:hypothetical protein